MILLDGSTVALEQLIAVADRGDHAAVAPAAAALAAVHALVRSRVPTPDDDRPPSPASSRSPS
jgi:hypothetical protein